MKNWSYWISGGVIVSSITLLVTIISLITGPITNWRSLGFFTYPVKFFLEEFIFEDLLSWSDVFYFTFPFSILFIIIVSAGFYFLIGALIGWIYGKIKSKK